MSISQLHTFLKHSQSVSFKSDSRDDAYEWISNTLSAFRYFALSKRERSLVKSYILKMTGFSDPHVKFLIARKKKTGRIRCGYTYPTKKRNSFAITYTPSDIALLIETDKLHRRLSAPATIEVFVRQHDTYGDTRFVRLKGLSNSHLYNLRDTKQYTSHTAFFEKTKPTSVAIGERRKPANQGKPGFLRVDTVHQGDYVDERLTKKGVYYINLIDEVTQWEIVVAVEGISERFLKPVLEDALEQFPFTIINFHSDNGSEFINKTVARLLNKIKAQQTKSRPRHCNDNALVETKNGAVIRKHMGHSYIPQKYAPRINEFYKTHLNPYLNYHRPCGFATSKVNRKGKIKKVYDVYQTPFDRLKSLPVPSNFLKNGVTMEMLEKTAFEMSDNASAKLMQESKRKLFKSFKI